MATYLYMDGVDDAIALPSISYNRFVFDIYAMPKIGVDEVYVAMGTNRFRNLVDGNDDQNLSSTAKYFIDDEQVTVNGTTRVVPDRRAIVRIELPLRSQQIHIYALNDFGQLNLEGNIYDLKFYNGTTLVAHYDMSTGTVNDISGNGNHATLTGGTWLDDGAGGDTGTTGSIQYDTKNIIYAEHSFQSDLQQKLYKLASSNLDTTQRLFSVDATNYDAKQVIYQTASILYDTLQTILDGGLIGSTSYDVKLQLYTQGTQSNDMKAEIYKLHEDEYDLRQAIYKASSTDGDIHLILYADESINYDMAQSIYQENITVDYDTKQTIFDPTSSIIGVIRLTGKRDLYVHLVGKSELEVNLKGKRELEIRLKGGL